MYILPMTRKPYIIASDGPGNWFDRLSWRVHLAIVLAVPCVFLVVGALLITFGGSKQAAFTLKDDAERGALLGRSINDVESQWGVGKPDYIRNGWTHAWARSSKDSSRAIYAEKDERERVVVARVDDTGTIVECGVVEISDARVDDTGRSIVSTPVRWPRQPGGQPP